MERIQRAICLAAGVLLLAGGTAQAGTGQTFTFPQGLARYPNLAKVQVDTYWVRGVGYYPVKVTIFNVPKGKAPGTPLTYDRDFRVVLRPTDYRYGGEMAAAEAVIELPAGTGQATAWIAVPKYAPWNSLEVEVREGGTRLRELSGHVSVNPNNQYMATGTHIEKFPAILFIDSKVPPREQRPVGRTSNNPAQAEKVRSLHDIRNWQELVPVVTQEYGPVVANTTSFQSHSDAISDAEVLDLVRKDDKVEMLPPDELPDQWLHYTCLDIIFISLSDAALLAEKHPARWEAVRRWAVTGGTLIVSDVAHDLSGVARLEPLLGMSARRAPAQLGEMPDPDGWQAAIVDFAANAPRRLTHWRDLAINEMQYRATPFTGDESTSSVQINVKTGEPPPFAIRKLGLGRIVAIGRADFLGQSPELMMWCLNQLGVSTLTSTERHGISFLRGNAGLFQYLIAGTQRVPVTLFLVLISVFMVAIGPVNYFWLNRSRRLYMLLVTVPGGAALVTLSLFGFALFSDGLGVRFRARSLTKIDQRTGNVVGWARQTYYAGLAPSGGLKFPADVAVYPVDDFPDNNRRRLIAWEGEQQHLRTGYLNSRESAQFLVIHEGKTQAKLAVAPGTENQPPSVTNELGAEVLHLVLRGHDGRYFVGASIAEGQTATLTPAKDGVSAVSELAPVAGRLRTSRERAYDPSDYDNELLIFNQRRYNNYGYYNYTGNMQPERSDLALLGRELDRLCTQDSFDLSPGTYAALLGRQPQMPMGHQPVREKDSLHVVEGRW